MDLRVVGDTVLRDEGRDYAGKLNPTERLIHSALIQHDGLASLSQLRSRLPDLSRAGSTVSQTLYGRTPIVERLGPSIFGLRGTRYDETELARLRQATASGHPWVDRAGWVDAVPGALRYRLSGRRSLPARLRMPAQFVDDDKVGVEGLQMLQLRTPDGVVHHIRVEQEGAGTYLNDLEVPMRSLSPAPLDSVEFRPGDFGTWSLLLIRNTVVDGPMTINLGRGWAAVPI